MRRANQKKGRKRENPREKPPGTPASRTWLVSHVAIAELEPTPDTAIGVSHGVDHIIGLNKELSVWLKDVNLRLVNCLLH